MKLESSKSKRTFLSQITKWFLVRPSVESNLRPSLLTEAPRRTTTSTTVASTASTAISDPSFAQVPAKNTDLPWYKPDISRFITPPVSAILESYAGIPPASQSKHMHAIRDKAWNIRAYPITGFGMFMQSQLTRSTARAQILKTLQNGGWFMDIGCFLGVDFRHLIVDGAPSDKMIGVDLVRQWDIGFEMYRDNDRFKGKFIEADIMNLDGNKELEQYKGHMDVIGISAVLHSWDWNGQVAAAKELVVLSQPGTIVVGYQVANAGAREAELVVGGKVTKQFRHNPDSFAKMWNIVGEATGTTWKTEASLWPWEKMGLGDSDLDWMEEGSVFMDFVVTRTK